MFRSKKDVDRHVQELFRKLKGEKERKCKYFNIARLYFQVGDYESARKYVASFLSVRDDSSTAHKLLGQSLEALGQKDNALAEYKCSLMLDSNQPDVVLKVCELMADADVKVDKDSAKYWSERAEQVFPHHSTVFKLKEKLVTSEKDCSSAELEKLILSELSARPKDVSLHVRLLHLYLESGRIHDAYTTAVEVEMRSAFREELKWYECLTEVCKAYAETTKPYGWEFFFYYTSVLERAACLNLQEQYGTPRRTWAQAVNAVFNFDQVLEVASCQTPPSSESLLYKEFLRHQRGQLCLHFATALFKKAKKEPSTWTDVSRAVVPLLLHALVPPVDVDAGWVSQMGKSRRKCVEWWAKEAAYRNSQAGHLIQSLVTERRSHFLERVMQFCAGNWRERLFQKIFSTRDHQQAIGTSHLVGHPVFANPPLHIPSSGELRPHDEMSQHLYPHSLHHMIWLGLQELQGCCKRGGTARLGADFRCLVFDNLQFSCSNPSLAGSETLCQLDIDAFLYASILCAKASLDEEQSSGYRSNERPQTLPANITDFLCSMSQSKWWTAAYRVNSNQARGDLGEIRQTLQRGVEVVRVLGNHGLDVRLIVQLARIFSERASIMATRSHAPLEMAEVEARAAMYWTSALPLLDKLKRNQTVRAPHTRLFEYQGKDLSMAEINTLMEEGHYFLACQMMKEDKHEKAIEAFQQLKSPYASFHQAMIYKKLAALEVEEQQGELITSEMRSRHIILLTKVRECLYLTLDRLRSPGVDRKHPLNAELGAHIEEIESQLARIDPDVWRSDVNRNDLDGVSDGSVSSGPSEGENGNFGYMSVFSPRPLNNSSRYNSTPYRNNHSHRIDSDNLVHDHSRRTEARPSPERLEAQIRHLMHGRDTQMQQVMQQNKALLESHRTVADNLNKVALSLEELKNLIQELIKKDSHKRSESRVNSDLPQVGDTDDDLYVFDEEYPEEVNITASHLGQFPAFPQYHNYPGTSYRQLPAMIGSSTVAYGAAAANADTTSAVPATQLLPPTAGMGNFFRNVDPALIYPQTLSYYGQGALPFSEGQQLPDFRAAPPGAPPGTVFSRLGPAPGHVPGSEHQGLHGTTKLNAPAVQPAPVNVVITSSDTLPTTVPQTQPTLSVTIPPQHRLGTPLVSSAVAGGLSQPPVGVPPVIPAGLPPTVPAVVAPVVPPGVPAGTITFPGVPGGTLPTALGGQLPYGTGMPPTPTISSAASTVPHAFQISMPPQAQVPVASRLEKGAAALSPVLPISTQTLLSSVPSPVYSAVGIEKATKESGSPPSTTTTTTTVSTSNANTPTATKVQASLLKPSKGQRVSTGSCAESEDGTEEVEHDPCPDFQPVIPLPAEVELTTGEEQEVVLYECRCKLFRFLDKEWKERGVGQLKLLHNQETGKVRLLMRREQVLKVCANHFLTPDMSLTRMKDKAWIWVANDFADEEVRLEKLCARFKTPEDADSFADAFSNACELTKKATKPEDTLGNFSEISVVAPATLTNTTPITVTSVPGEKIVVGGFTFVSPPKFTTTSKVQAEKEVVKEKDKADTPIKPSPFAQLTLCATTKSSHDQVASSLVGSPLIKLPLSGTPATIVQSTDVTTPASVDREQLPPLRRPHLSSLVTSSSPALEVIQRDKPLQKDSAGGGDPLIFSASNLPSFSSLASAASDKLVFQTSSTFKGFEGAGTPLFAKTPVAGAKKDKDVKRSSTASGGGEDGDEEFVPTQEFTPVISMPQLVEIKTGEEGQEVVYEEHAKLLRYDSETKQWKERGIGTMKILKDPQTGCVRLLMRRAQVLKVCCNHLLSSSLEFNILKMCDRAWSWCARDYSEGEVKTELFALRFKTVEQTQAFGNKIKELQSQMVNNKLPVSGNSSSPLSNSFAATVSNKQSSSDSEFWKCGKCMYPNNSSDSKVCRSCSGPHTPKEFVTPSAGGDKLKLTDLFKPPAGSWECTSCYTRNNANVDHCVCCDESRITRSPPKPPSEPFKPKKGAWECKNCYSRNEEIDRRCSSCSSEKPSATPTKQNGPSSLKPLSELFKPKPGTWECQVCLIRNDSNAIQCASCTTPRPGCEQEVKDKIKTEPSTFGPLFGFPGTGQSTGFTFGISKQGDAQDTSDKPKTDNTTTSSGFSFGVNKSQSVFGSSTLQENKSQSLTPGTTQSSATSVTVFGSQPVFGSWSGSFGVATTATTSLTFGTPSTASTNAKMQSSVVSSTSSIKQEVDKPFSFDAKQAPFQFGTSSTSKPFSFGIQDTTEKRDPPADSGFRNFVFGSPQSFEFNFSGIRPKSPVKSPKSPGVVGASGGEDDSGSEPEEDEGEHIYFQPVIPLPEEVPVHTGEEEEEVLYSHRAKLFRFIDGMWKERGVGDVKILKHSQTHKVRLVMRREIVLKLCLNHFLTSDMVFSEKDEKSWLWIAADFSDGEIKREKLAIRFKNKDVAAAFKEAIDKTQANLHSQDMKTEDKSDGTDPKEAANGMVSCKGGNMSDDPENLMHMGRTTSSPSSDAKDDVEIVYEFRVSPEEKEAAERLKLPPNFYSYKRLPPCPGCCGCEPDSDSEDKMAANNSAASSGIDSSKLLQSGNAVNPPLFMPSFGAPLPFSQTSNVLPPTTQPSPLVFTPSSAPFVTSSSTFTTGSSMFGTNSQRKGPLFAPSSQSASIFGSVTADSTSVSKALASFSFSPSKNTDITTDFGQVSVTSNLKPNPENTSIFGKNPVNTSPNVQSTTVIAPTVLGSGSQSGENVGLFSYFGNTSSNSSFGLSSDKPMFGQMTHSNTNGSESVVGSSTPISTVPSASPIFGMNICPPTCTVNSTLTINSQPSVKSSGISDKPFGFNLTSKTGEAGKEENSPFSLNTSSGEPDKTKNKNDESGVKEQTDEGVPFLTSGLSFSSLASLGGKTSFIQAADPIKPFTWSGTGSQVFGFSYNKVKDSIPKKDADGDGSSNEDETPTIEECHDPHFEPIIALPDAIEVRTGEEEEEKVFCERAKLFRYEAENSQWKERGVGEMKILKHPIRGTYRLLLRREQVHKVVLNQLVTSELELLPLSTEGSWCWWGLNFAEDESTGELPTDPKTEKLAVKFKNTELAQNFALCVKECVAELQARPQTSALIPEVVQNIYEGSAETKQSAKGDKEDDNSDKVKEDQESNNDEEEEGEDNAEDEDDDDNDHDDNDDEDEENDEDLCVPNIMFEKRATLEVHEPGNDSWKTLGMGALQIIRDDFEARVFMEADGTRDELCNCLIDDDTNLKATQKDCIWTAMDHSIEPSVKRTFKARFSSVKAAQEFLSVFEEGKEIVQQILQHS